MNKTGGMAMMEQGLLPHKLVLNERKHLTVTGVTEVVSFDEHAVVLHTGLGVLSVQGEALQLKMLAADGGEMAVEGTVTALFYEEPRRGGMLRRLLG